MQKNLLKMIVNAVNPEAAVVNLLIYLIKT